MDALVSHVMWGGMPQACAATSPKIQGVEVTTSSLKALREPGLEEIVIATVKIEDSLATSRRLIPIDQHGVIRSRSGLLIHSDGDTPGDPGLTQKVGSDLRTALRTLLPAHQAIVPLEKRP